MEGGQRVRIEELGRLRMTLVERAGLAPALPDLLAGAGEHLLVVGVLPLHQVFDDLEQALTLDGRLFLVHPAPQLALVAGVVDHLRKDHRPRRGQRPARPPQVQRAGVAVADRLLARRSDVDGVEREGDFDEFFWGLEGGHVSGRQKAVARMCRYGALCRKSGKSAGAC